MNKAFVNEKEYQVPGTWKELSYNQKYALLKIRFQPNADSLEDRHLRAVPILLQVSPWKRFKLWYLYWWKMGFEDIETFFPLAEPFMEGEIPLPFEKLKRGEKVLFPPEQFNFDFTFAEYVKIESILKGAEPDKERKIAAVLYREKDKQGERAVYSEKEIQGNEALFKPWEARAITRYALQHINKIVAGYLGSVFKKKEESKPTRDYTWTDAYMDIAKTADRLEVVGQQPLIAVFFQIKRDIERNKALKDNDTQ